MFYSLALGYNTNYEVSIKSNTDEIGFQERQRNLSYFEEKLELKVIYILLYIEREYNI